MAEFNGRLAVVTGGANGIGRATAAALRREGADVIIADRDRAHGAEAALQTGSDFRHADLTSAADVATLAEDVSRRHRGLDVLVHSVGVQHYGTALTTDESAWDEVMAVNAKSAFIVTKALLPRLIENRGSVVIVGSVQSTAAFANSLAYVASKHALWGLTQALAVDYAGQVRVNCVAPGSVRTPMLQWSARHLNRDVDEAFKEWAGLHPMQRIAEPAEVAEVILFLASSRASFVTGSLYGVDGGMRAALRSNGPAAIEVESIESVAGD